MNELEKIYELEDKIKKLESKLEYTKLNPELDPEDFIDSLLKTISDFQRHQKRSAVLYEFQNQLRSFRKHELDSLISTIKTKMEESKGDYYGEYNEVDRAITETLYYLGDKLSEAFNDESGDLQDY